MNIQESTFGSYIFNKRKNQGITQKQIADAMGVTAVYICDIEKNRRYPPTNGNLLTKLAIALNLSENDIPIYYDLAGQNKGCVPPDIACYIMSSDVARGFFSSFRENFHPFAFNHQNISGHDSFNLPTTKKIIHL